MFPYMIEIPKDSKHAGCPHIIQNVVIETGAYDQPAWGPRNFIGYYVGGRDLMIGWKEYMYNLQKQIARDQNSVAGQGFAIGNGLGNPIIPFRQNPPQGPPVNGYWDYWGDFTSYICKNVNLSTSCY